MRRGRGASGRAEKEHAEWQEDLQESVGYRNGEKKVLRRKEYDKRCWSLNMIKKEGTFLAVQ